MKAMIHARKCRMRAALITEEAAVVAAAEAEYAWEFLEWAAVRTAADAGAAAVAETKAMRTANRCNRSWVRQAR